MCDYSLTNVTSRPAAVGDKLITHNFGTGSRGFAGADDPNTGNQATAVCLLPGTEIAFDEDAHNFGEVLTLGKVAIFRQVHKEQPHQHHDALEFPCGEKPQTVLLTFLAEGQKVTVLQLPAAPKTEAEAQEQKRVEYTG